MKTAHRTTPRLFPSRCVPKKTSRPCWTSKEVGAWWHVVYARRQTPHARQVTDDWAALLSGWAKVEKPNDVSPLYLFGSTAFPIVTAGGDVTLAGAHLGKGRLLAAGHQWMANFACFQMDNAKLEANMLSWLRPGTVAGTGRVLLAGYELGCCRNGSNPIPCPAGVGTVQERLDFFKSHGYGNVQPSDFVPDSRTQPHSPWNDLPQFNISDYDLVIFRRVEDSIGIHTDRIAQVRDFVQRGGSAILTGRMCSHHAQAGANLSPTSTLK